LEPFHGKIFSFYDNFFLVFSDSKKNENFQMTKSSFASFHLTGIKTSAGKLMSASVDKLFANDGEIMNGSTMANSVTL
jgi:hypothetical protein